MEAIANLVQDDPYLKLSREQRIAARRERKAKFQARTSVKKKARFVVVEGPVLKLKELPPEPSFSFGDWVERQHQLNPLAKAPWFSIESDVSGPRHPKIDEIQRIIRNYYGFTKAELIAERRTAKIVHARQVAMYLAKTMTPRSLPEIGRKFGGRDHTTVLHAVRKIEKLLTTDAKLLAEIDALKAMISCLSGYHP
ncbi:MAG: helix-turn-helix domain-containing protein [Arenimonas sp.]|jgi:hypothetical protein